MDDAQSEPEKLISSWAKSFKEGTDHDLWGQPVEAIESYRRLSKQLKTQAKPDGLYFNDEQKKVIGKIATCLDLRNQVLQNPGTFEGISLKDLKKVESSLRNLLSKANKPKEFPVDVVAAQAHAEAHSPRTPRSEDGEVIEADQEEEIIDPKARGNLLSKPRPVEGQTILTVRIEKIGLKDASQFIDSFMTVSVKDRSGLALTPAQDTSIANRKEGSYILFGTDVYIQKTLEIMPAGFAIFFEFKHYKPKKKTISTKCWALLEKDEIKEGPAVLELYKKPTDFKRKNINLLTIKPLYLHLKLSLN